MESNWSEKSAEIRGAFEDKLNDAKWKQEKEQDGITVYKAQWEPGYCWKAEATLSGLAVDTVWQHFQGSWEARLQWDKGLQPTCQLVERLSDTLTVDYSATNPALGGVISARDFVDLRDFERSENKIIAWGGSVEHNKKPPTKGTVRGFNHPCGCVLESASDAVKFTLIWHSEIKGWVPSSAINRAMPAQMIDLIQNLESYIKSL